MAREKKIYSDDDGRVIADMSGIERQPLVLPRLKSAEKKHRKKIRSLKYRFLSRSGLRMPSAP